MSLSFGEALMRLMQGQGKKRFNSRVVERWSSPLISTSNFSVFSPARSEAPRRITRPMSTA